MGCHVDSRCSQLISRNRNALVLSEIALLPPNAAAQVGSAGTNLDALLPLQ
jgi:hypothetical protein